MIPKEKLKKDEWAVTLDYLSHGRYSMDRSQPVAQVMGDLYFSLLEVIVREGSTLKVGERVYIGDGKRDKVKYIRGRMEPSSSGYVRRKMIPVNFEYPT